MHGGHTFARIHAVRNEAASTNSSKTEHGTRTQVSASPVHEIDLTSSSLQTETNMNGSVINGINISNVMRAGRGSAWTYTFALRTP